MALAPILSPAQVTVLRKLTRDPNYRATFLKAPAATAKAAGLNPAETAGISKISAQEIDGLYRASLAVGGGRADDNCTLVYAIAFAVALALLLADTAVGSLRE
jgi:hypothetical protein